MTIEITKGIIAVIIVAAAVYSLIVGEAAAQGFLIPLATFTFGYYFRSNEEPVVRKFKATFGKKQI